jgi:hypothetical protein
MRTLLKICLFVTIFLAGCQKRPVRIPPPSSFLYNPEGAGHLIIIDFSKGKSFNHPLFAIWVEDENGHFIQTLYVSESVGKGVFQHGDASSGKWKPGPVRRPAALPYWGHRRGIAASDGLYIPDPENPIPDAYTGPTPGGDFLLQAHLDDGGLRKFRVLLEINQPWDWNEYWTNDKHPGDEDYKSSCQPAVVYETQIDMDDPQTVYEMKAIGHSHYSGKTGELFPDLSTLTTALQIAGSIRISVQ